VDQAARLTNAAGVRTTPPDQRKAGVGGLIHLAASAKRRGPREPRGTPLAKPLHTPSDRALTNFSPITRGQSLPDHQRGW
jgi:hypothetical protein